MHENPVSQEPLSSDELSNRFPSEVHVREMKPNRFSWNTAMGGVHSKRLADSKKKSKWLADSKKSASVRDIRLEKNRDSMVKRNSTGSVMSSATTGSVMSSATTEKRDTHNEKEGEGEVEEKKVQSRKSFFLERSKLRRAPRERFQSGQELHTSFWELKPHERRRNCRKCTGVVCLGFAGAIVFLGIAAVIVQGTNFNDISSFISTHFDAVALVLTFTIALITYSFQRDASQQAESRQVQEQKKATQRKIKLEADQRKLAQIERSMRLLFGPVNVWVNATVIFNACIH